MKLKNFVKMAAAVAAVLLVATPVKAEASEYITSAEYGDVIVTDGDGSEVLLFAESNEKTLQFLKEAAGDPYYVRYNSMDAVLAKLKATAVSVIEMDENGNVVSVKGQNEILQDVAAHLAAVTAMDAMTPEQRLALENAQMARLAQQGQEINELLGVAAPALEQAVAAGDQADAAEAQLLIDLCTQLNGLVMAKQQVILLYQQQAAPEIQQQALLTVQNYAATSQQQLMTLLQTYADELMQEMMAAFS